MAASVFDMPSGPVEVWADETRAGIEDRWHVEYRKAMAGWLLGQRSQHTRRAYAQSWRVWCAWCVEAGLEPTEPGRGAGGAFVASQRAAGLADQTIRLRSIAVANALELLTYEGLRNGPDPFARQKLPQSRGPADRVGLTTEQVLSLIDAARGLSGRHEAAVLLCAVVGLRAAEAGQVCDAALAASPDGLVATIVRKGNTRAVVPIPDVIVKAASRDRWPHRDDKDDAANADAVSFAVATAWQATGMPGIVRSHALRHYHATVALDLGVTLDKLQDSMGHASPNTTMGYVDGRGKVRDHSAHAVLKLLVPVEYSEPMV
jgi:integrase/recombinase XerD